MTIKRYDGMKDIALKVRLSACLLLCKDRSVET
jgi:hypothetical protein